MRPSGIDDENQSQRNVEQLLGIAALVLLLIGVFYVLKTFITAILWSAILAFALYPVQRLVTRWFRGKKVLAAVVVALALTVLLVVPVVLLGFSLKDDAVKLGNTAWHLMESLPEKTPDQLKNTPLLGSKLDSYWQDASSYRKKWMERFQKERSEPQKTEEVASSSHKQKLIEEPQSQIPVLFAKVVDWFQAWLPHATIVMGSALLQIIFSMLLTFFILCHGEELGTRLSVVMHRIAGVRGHRLMHIAGRTVRGVVYGIIGTALAQGVLAGIGLSLAGVPAAVLLGVLTFFLSALPIGPPLVWLPTAIWLFSEHKTGWGVFMLVWGVVVVSGVDNIIKPYLISHGSKIPFVIVLMGIIGGAIGFGPVGIFLGPTLLAVTYRMITEWSSDKSLTTPLTSRLDSNS